MAGEARARVRAKIPAFSPNAEFFAFGDPVGVAAASASLSLDACGSGGVGLAKGAITRGGGNSAARSGDR